MMWARRKKKQHRFEVLSGEVLDNHMMAMHGWTVRMVSLRGTQTIAQRSEYIGNAHRLAHKDQT